MSDMGVIRPCRLAIIYPASRADSTRRAGLPDDGHQPGRGRAGHVLRHAGRRLRARTERAAVDAAVAMQVTLNDALDPIVRQLGRVATATSRHEREALQEAAIPMVVDSAAHLVGSGRVRACLFRFAPGTPQALMPTQYSGRV